MRPHLEYTATDARHGQLIATAPCYQTGTHPSAPSSLSAQVRPQLPLPDQADTASAKDAGNTPLVEQVAPPLDDFSYSGSRATYDLRRLKKGDHSRGRLRHYQVRRLRAAHSNIRAPKARGQSSPWPGMGRAALPQTSLPLTPTQQSQRPSTAQSKTSSTR